MRKKVPATKQDTRIVRPHRQESLNEAELRSIVGQFGRAKRQVMVEGRFRNMTPEQPTQEARRISQARWAKKESAGEQVDSG
jgi:hypothetical protein